MDLYQLNYVFVSILVDTDRSQIEKSYMTGQTTLLAGDTDQDNHTTRLVLW